MQDRCWPPTWHQTRDSTRLYIASRHRLCPRNFVELLLPALKAAVLQLGSSLDKGLIVHTYSSLNLHSDFPPRIFPEFSQNFPRWSGLGFTVVFRVESHSSTFLLDLVPLVCTTLLLTACTAVFFRWLPTSRNTAPLRKQREEARTRIEALGEPFKMEILDAIKTEPITIYHVGDQWWDLCAGPHVETTGEMPHPPSSRKRWSPLPMHSVRGVWGLVAPTSRHVYPVYTRRPRQLRRCTALGRAA